MYILGTKFFVIMSLESLYVYGTKGSYYGDVHVQSLIIHNVDSVIHCDM